VFLLITPLEKPDVQLYLLGQLARVAGDVDARERLAKATSHAEVIDIVAEGRESPAGGSR
jgi:mannitol/fructose-specific phosphotransferase system IIA component (Ntr-type)